MAKMRSYRKSCLRPASIQFFTDSLTAYSCHHIDHNKEVHTYEEILAVVVKEPLLEIKQATVIGGEALLPVLGKDAVGRSDDCGDEKGLVYIDAATDRIYEFHADPPS